MSATRLPKNRQTTWNQRLNGKTVRTNADIRGSERTTAAPKRPIGDPGGSARTVLRTHAGPKGGPKGRSPIQFLYTERDYVFDFFAEFSTCASWLARRDPNSVSSALRSKTPLELVGRRPPAARNRESCSRRSRSGIVFEPGNRYPNFTHNTKYETAREVRPLPSVNGWIQLRRHITYAARWIGEAVSQLSLM